MPELYLTLDIDDLLSFELDFTLIPWIELELSEEGRMSESSSQPALDVPFTFENNCGLDFDSFAGVEGIGPIAFAHGLATL